MQVCRIRKVVPHLSILRNSVFALLKPARVGRHEMLLRHAERTDTVDAVNRRIQIVRIFKRLFAVNVPDIGGKIEIILGKQDSNRLYKPRHRLLPLELLIFELPARTFAAPPAPAPRVPAKSAVRGAARHKEAFRFQSCAAPRAGFPPARSSLQACRGSAAFHRGASNGFPAEFCRPPEFLRSSAPSAQPLSGDNRPQRGHSI